MPESPSPFELPPQAKRIDQICDEFETAWQDGTPPPLERFLEQAEPHVEEQLFYELLSLDVDYRRRSPSAPSEEEYLARFPDWAATIRRVMNESRGESLVGTVVADRYAVERELGAGSFGKVYLAHDQKLDRRVALKVGQRHSRNLQMLEPRVAAQFEHDHIVKIHDVNQLEDGRLTIISQYIDGQTLKARMAYFQRRPHQSAQLIAKVARALHYAHQKLVYHRDVTPSNILIDAEGRPYLTDFGLAAREGDFETPGHIAGTPAYMSPEQANGEVHLVDQRSDVFSLCTILYELLVGSRPFRGKTQTEVLTHVRACALTPAHTANPRVPAELDRILNKGLQRLAAHRYEDAASLADDLEAWLSDVDAVETVPIRRKADQLQPRGLDPFLGEDASFFKRLIPGPCAKQGLPESIDFWRKRIEARGEAEPFRVGVLFGASGSGKSSLVRAGIQPSLRGVTCCIVNATASATPSRLLEAIQAEFPDLSKTLSLTEALREIRSGRLLGGFQRLLVVLDQFEQCLIDESAEQRAELVSALRQCDGDHVQAMLLVRSDFWGPLAKFLTEIDVQLQNNNHRTMESFSAEHSQAVLLELGRGYGSLQESLATEHAKFADLVVNQMLEDGELKPIRLALFARAFHEHAWTRQSLNDLGGVRGVVGCLIDKVIDDDEWLARHRVVTQRILRALAPSRSRNETNEPRAQMSAAEIALAAGVDEGLCLQLLRNLRRSSPLLSTVEIPGQGRQFQLAHDYLVPIVRQWSDRRLGATLWGRTEALLTDRAEAWQASASRPLPSFGEWAQLLLFGRRVPWGPQSQRMMRAATVRYAGSIALALMVLMSGFMIWLRWDRNRTVQQAVLELAHARTEQVPGLVADQPATTRPGVAARITERLATAASDDASSEQLKTELNLSLALLGLEGSPHVEAVARLIGAIPDPEVEQWPSPPSLQSAYSLMAPHVAGIRDPLQQVVNDPEATSRHRRRAAGLLAQAAVPPEQWLSPAVRKRLVADLIEVSPVYVNEWIQIMQPVGGELLAEWRDVLASPDEATAITRALFASAYADPSQQLELLTEALPMQIPIIAQAIGKDQRDLLWEAFQSTALPPPPMLPEVDVLSAEQALLTCEGTAAASGAIAQAIPLDAFPEIQASLASCKYHLDTLRPYERDGRLWCAATWLPGVRETAYMVGLSAEEARELVGHWSPQHHASDLTNYGDFQQARLAMVWHRKLQTDLPQDISINLTRDEHESRALTRQQTRFLSTRISVTVSPQGEERYSEIWEQFPREHADYRGPKVIPGTEDWNHSHLLRDRQLVFPMTMEGSALSYLDTLLHFGASRNMFIYELGLAGYEEMLAGDLLAHAWGYQFYRPGEAMEVLRRHQMDVISASAWSDTTDRTSQVFSSRSTTDHARACREALEQGQIPASISVRCSPDEVALASVWHAYVMPEATIREVASRHVHYALGLANLDQWEALREVLRGDHGRMAASYAVHWIHGAQTTSERFISQIQPHGDDTLTYYSLLALAELDDGQTGAVARCLESIQSDEANVRSAIAYCGRRRGVLVEHTGDDSLASKLGIEMIRVDRPPAPLFIGGACWQEEFASGNQSQLRPTSLANDFELSATEITVAAFRTFADSERIRKHYHDTLERYPPLSERSRDAAQYRVTFFDAAMFCQWLSEEAGVPVEEQCYPGIWDVAEGTYVAPADMLSRSGYRLPLETEFEIACRAGSQASRHYGPDLALLPAYAWIATNSDNDAHPVGWKRPNEFGFFDMLGNVDEWCHNTSGNYYEQHFKRPLALTSTAYRLLRGGDFKDIGDARPDYSKGARPKYRNRLVGFRIARTCAE